jgi:hypothetical protein
MSNPSITANDLRFAGEEADSIRNQPAFLILGDDGKPHVVAQADLNGRTPLLQLSTESRGAGMRGNVKVQLVVDGKPYTKEIPHLDDADSVFLTQSAIDKFVLPYYMRFRSAGQVGAMENKLFNVQDVLAAFHIPGSVLFGFPPKIGVISLNRNTGDCECTLIPGDGDDDTLHAMKRVRNPAPKKSGSGSKTPAKKPRKR